jgi:large subunit ribosomal protein L1
MDIKKALEEIRKEKKRKFVQTVDLVVNLKDFDVRKEALNTFVNLPHPSEKKIGAFLTKKSSVVDTITEVDFVKYKELVDMKKLAKKYDFFIAVAPMMGKIATKFGRVFGPMGKMPSPQAGIIPKEDDASIREMLDKMNKVVRVRTKEMSIKLPIGKEDMKDSDLEENANSVLKQLEKHLPRGPENIKNASLKFTMTKSIKFLDRAKKTGDGNKVSEEIVEDKE